MSAVNGHQVALDKKTWWLLCDSANCHKIHSVGAVCLKKNPVILENYTYWEICDNFFENW